MHIIPSGGYVIFDTVFRLILPAFFGHSVGKRVRILLYPAGSPFIDETLASLVGFKLQGDSTNTITLPELPGIPHSVIPFWTSSTPSWTSVSTCPAVPAPHSEFAGNRSESCWGFLSDLVMTGFLNHGGSQVTMGFNIGHAWGLDDWCAPMLGKLQISSMVSKRLVIMSVTKQLFRSSSGIS